MLGKQRHLPSWVIGMIIFSKWKVRIHVTATLYLLQSAEVDARQDKECLGRFKHHKLEKRAPTGIRTSLSMPMISGFNYEYWEL